MFDKEVFVRGGGVKPRVCRPPPGSNELSVYRIDYLKESTVGRIGKYFVEELSKRRNPHIIGHSIARVQEIITSIDSLAVVASRYPHPRHANITGIPLVKRERGNFSEEEWEHSKQIQNVVAMELADQFSRQVHLRN